jgi:glutamyl-tRNA synthetase
MDAELERRVERAAEVAALVNALKHDSNAQVGAILGPLMGEHPEFREHGDEVPGVVAPVVERVNGLDADERRARLEELDPEALAELESDDGEEDEGPLPDLPNAEEGEVRMRLAPNPNGPWHLGNARMPAVIGTYKEMSDGWMLCRFDDTDPEIKRPDLDAYDAILDAIDYLGFQPDEVIRASDRVETYYEYARRLIDEGGAYTCSCPAEEFSRLKNDAEACPHRGKAPETTREEFDAMVDGSYDPGEMVLRVCTDIDHPNPALRDWVAFRIVGRAHPRPEAADYRCWPMLDFQSGIDDHLTGITHVIRGIDLQDSAGRQQFVYDYFGWEYPEVIHWGHVGIDAYDVDLSTSTIKRLIENGDLDGWDDPRAPTVASVRRRGIRGEALVEALVELGTSTSDADLAMSSVYAANRDRIDDEADRAFLVRGGERWPVVDGEAAAPDAGHPPVHPDHEERGRRDVPVEEAVLLEPGDVPAEGKRVWLKGYGPVRREDGTLAFTGDDIEVVRDGGVPVVHWVPEEGIPTLLCTPDGDVAGHAEPGVGASARGAMLQFERVGFARVDATGERAREQAAERGHRADLVAYYAHP